MTGIPIYNVNNNCSTGSSALYLGKQIIESHNAECVLVLGFEKMQSGSLTATVRNYEYFYRYRKSYRDLTNTLTFVVINILFYIIYLNNIYILALKLIYYYSLSFLFFN